MKAHGDVIHANNTDESVSTALRAWHESHGQEEKLA